MLRRATADDVDAITTVTAIALGTYREFAPPGWEPPADMTDERLGARLAREDAWGTVAEQDGRIVGFGAFEAARDGHDGPIIGRLAHVWAVFALPETWGTGVATRVLEAVMAEIGARRYPEARLFTPAPQARARRFYAREGWREAGEPFHVEALGLDMVELRRSV